MNKNIVKSKSQWINYFIINFLTCCTIHFDLNNDISNLVNLFRFLIDYIPHRNAIIFRMIFPILQDNLENMKTSKIYLLK